MSLSEQFKLDGKVALITGGGKGIGAGIARTFAEAGAKVAIAARTRTDLEQVAAEVAKLGSEALVIEADVLDYDQLRALAPQVIKHFGRLDILVNNAGGGPPRPTAEISVEEFEYVFRFNVSTAYELTRSCVPLMVETAGGGVVLNISSVAGEKPAPCFAAYGTAKAALSYLTRVLAQEYAPKVRVNAIAVGSTRTDALQAVLNDEIEKTMVELTPLARLGEVEDVAMGALYLCSPAASYVSGDILGLNGGLERLNMKMPRAWGGEH
ncbi:glucose 1-dehydrogenase [Parahaliea sp. F7430]|uniref:Glucose 1-dehydrogenase n=1 Tax=Sediminihaliea albiluteola TaxID=2758564 RepID=A0A7W2TYB1_9GAMM|nr:glucose 1-dehydrogenase [Sediminihaliea albiluteola]MBA6414166.1 glucose 1-dehydrogenase [Sediminihaliea albiluteola]